MLGVGKLERKTYIRLSFLTSVRIKIISSGTCHSNELGLIVNELQSPQKTKEQEHRHEFNAASPDDLLLLAAVRRMLEMVHSIDADLGSNPKHED